MRRGDGVIRLRATGPIETVGQGAHRLQFENAHRPDISVYLVNALLPADERIAISGQSRDFLQRSYVVDYNVSLAKDPLKKAASVLPVLLSLAMAGTFFAIASKLN
jgi:hypothetical protein